jgi:hypothetical protein
MPSTTKRRSSTRRNREQGRQVTTPPARIRIPNSMVEAILAAPPERPTMDAIQAQLTRLNESTASRADRILVTHNDESLDLLRDWCTRLIADYRLSDNAGDKKLVAAASKVIGFMDGYQSRAQRAAKHVHQSRTN